MTPPRPPQPERRPHVLELHGRTRTDDYYWLRDDNWQAVMRDPSVLRADIRAHLEAENAYTEAMLAHTAPLQDALFEEMKGRIKEDDATVPVPDGPYAYYSRFETGGQHPLLCRGSRDNPQASEEVLLHGDRLAEGHDYFSLGGVAYSPDHRLLAFATDTQGSEYYTVTVKDLSAGTNLDDHVESTAGDIIWAPDSKAFFYVKLDDHHRPSTVWRHCLGTPQSEDTLIYQEADPAFYVGIDLTESRRFIVITVHDHQTSELYLLDANQTDAPLRRIAPRRTEHEYSVTDNGDWLYVLTNSGGAEDFRIMRAPINTPDEVHWTELVPHEAGRLILDLLMMQNHLVRLERKDGLPRIVMTRLNDDGTLGEPHEIAMPEEAYSLGLRPGAEFDTAMLRFVYASPTTPQQVFDYEMESGDRTLLKTQDVPSGHDPSAYRTRRLHVAAEDGAPIPVTILYHAGTALDGSAPVLLYGYGSYGISLPADFRTSRLSLVDRGVVYAMAHVRGGMDKGYGWYRDGKRLRKKNTFTDFIAAARGLIDMGITKPGQIVAQGGSAGGLLVGAATNMAPDLFRAVIAEVPFVDTLTTICDETLPLTPPEWTEWGNPITDETVYDYMASYSPYDQITAQAYPDILATAGLSDPRVTYWEPAKWVARLREQRTDAGRTLLWTYMTAGHGGAAGRFEQLRETAHVYAFALDALERIQRISDH